MSSTSTTFLNTLPLPILIGLWWNFGEVLGVGQQQRLELRHPLQRNSQESVHPHLRNRTFRRENAHSKPIISHIRFLLDIQMCAPARISNSLYAEKFALLSNTFHMVPSWRKSLVIILSEKKCESLKSRPGKCLHLFSGSVDAEEYLLIIRL